MSNITIYGNAYIKAGYLVGLTVYTCRYSGIIEAELLIGSLIIFYTFFEVNATS